MSLLSEIFAYFNYWVVVILIMLGMYVVMANPNLVKKVIGLNIFQTAVFIFYISMGEIEGGTAPILDDAFTRYANPLPHVLILTAIVVGVATTALALALAVRIYRAYESVEEDEIDAEDARAEVQE
ncbi:MAG: Na+/H+ antiporter subunit C [Gammaproteobacteria bacterium]|nr:Na+/H+ antiporter subunit C [Gammaproteobacteria bacterium]NIM71751.1 Na+/H+ antiporter subunit C [Gammaproteobacteria bacterium]NIN37847.1 Na+/H+ antiporter subunit C [Gammaproteobacteria bacterium]NIO23507.1 Na+/H+ antiporter subunit C [Gammaproteobacteria bacterium]NIO64123.1 Na+/H+ antiporter subunit C [Gammaproteobacteria bacterium]